VAKGPLQGPEPASPVSVRVVSLEQQIDVHLHIPADRVAAARQLHLPLESELATVEARVELQSRDLAEGARSWWRVVTAGGDRARDASDRELAVDLCPAVVDEANETGAAAAAFGDTASIISGGLACITGALVLFALLPGFRGQRADTAS
jgi:hypothetical protein